MAKRDRFKAPRAVPTVDIPLPEVGEGEFVRARKITARNLLDIRKAHGGEPELAELGFMYDVFAKTFVDDETSELMFTDRIEAAEYFCLTLETAKRVLLAVLEFSGVGTGEKN